MNILKYELVFFTVFVCVMLVLVLCSMGNASPIRIQPLSICVGRRTSFEIDSNITITINMLFIL